MNQKTKHEVAMAVVAEKNDMSTVQTFADHNTCNEASGRLPAQPCTVGVLRTF